MNEELENVGKLSQSASKKTEIGNGGDKSWHPRHKLTRDLERIGKRWKTDSIAYDGDRSRLRGNQKLATTETEVGMRLGKFKQSATLANLVNRLRRRQNLVTTETEVGDD